MARLGIVEGVLCPHNKQLDLGCHLSSLENGKIRSGFLYKVIKSYFEKPFEYRLIIIILTLPINANDLTTKLLAAHQSATRLLLLPCSVPALGSAHGERGTMLPTKVVKRTGEGPAEARRIKKR